MPEHSALWREVLVELRGRMDHQTFDKLLRGSFVLDNGQSSSAGGSQRVPGGGSAGPRRPGPEAWLVAVREPTAPLWLERYHVQVTETASRVAGRPVCVAFQVATPGAVAARHRELETERPVPAVAARPDLAEPIPLSGTLTNLPFCSIIII